MKRILFLSHCLKCCPCSWLSFQWVLDVLEGYVFPSHFSCPDEDPKQESRENLGREQKWKKELDFMGCDGVCIGIEKKRNEEYFVCVCLDAFNFNVIIPLIFLLSLG